MEFVPIQTAKEFLSERFCIQDFDSKKLKLDDLEAGVGNFTHKKWVLNTIFLVYDETYAFIYNVEKKQFGIWKGHEEKCCGMSCDYYTCDLNYF